MYAQDVILFRLLNDLAGRWTAVDIIGIVCASYLIWLMASLVAVWWFLDRRRRLLSLVSTAIAAVLGWCVSQGIGIVYFRPRPFAVLTDVHQLVVRSALDKSFPSDHATLAFAVAVSVRLVNRRWGNALLVVAALVSVGRVFVGVHYPSDIIMGALVGSASAVGAHALIHGYLKNRHRWGKQV